MVRVRADCNGASGNSRPLTPRRAFVIRQITPKQTPTARRQAAMRQIEFVSFSTAEQARVRALSSCRGDWCQNTPNKTSRRPLTEPGAPVAPDRGIGEQALHRVLLQGHARRARRRQAAQASGRAHAQAQCHWQCSVASGAHSALSPPPWNLPTVQMEGGAAISGVHGAAHSAHCCRHSRRHGCAPPAGRRVRNACPEEGLTGQPCANKHDASRCPRPRQASRSCRFPPRVTCSAALWTRRWCRSAARRWSAGSTPS